MSLAIVYSRASVGVEAPLVTVEAHLSNGMAAFNIVGLPEAAVKESRDRVRSALVNTQFDFPVKRITINLAPADLPKEGGRFDLPIALGILAASGQIPKEILTAYEFLGELALSGELRSIRGILPVVLAAYQSGRHIIVPQQNSTEAALIKHENVLSATHLLEVCAHLKGERQLAFCLPTQTITSHAYAGNLSDVKGQQHAKRALEIAAAGRHSLLLIGPPGTGKTMLASRLISLLPALNEQESLEVAAIASVSSNGFDVTKWRHIPFRSPHHSSSNIALVGGGRPPCPGEVSLAHHGILFLDELPEFSRPVLECLREPLESGHITISRAAYQAVYPAKFQLLAAMNPCPCGYAGSHKDCQCTLEQVRRYIGKISGPLLDRIDMHVEVARLPPELLASFKEDAQVDESCQVRERVAKAILYQKERQQKLNTELTVPELAHYCDIEEAAQQLLLQAMAKFTLSARAYHRIMKVARTIADLEGSPIIKKEHLGEALHYRCLDRANIAHGR